MNPRIITASPFFNELDLLEIKIRELGDEVDAHLIVESTRTFTGIRKPLYFAENEARFADIRTKIIHVVVELPEFASSPWVREELQHRAILQAVRALNPEIVIWGDTDEAPRRGTVARFRAMDVPVAIVDLDRLLYFFDRFDFNDRPTASRIARFDRDAGRQPWRGMVDLPVVKDAGWHFQYFQFGRKEHLLDKLRATSHAVEPGSHIMQGQVDAGEFPGIDRAVRYPDAMLPSFVADNRARFSSAFLG